MNLISEELLPIYLQIVQNSPIFYKLYFENFCCVNKYNIDFASKTKNIVKKYFGVFVETLICEENAIGTSLSEDRYNEIIDFVSILNDIDSNELVFESHNNIGHIYFLLEHLILLNKSRSKNLRDVVLKTLKKICC